MSVDARSRQAPRILALLLILLSVISAAPAKNNPPSKPANRFLFVIETSRAAGKRSKGISATIENLLKSGIQGEAQADDTIGIWTFNETLTAGEFPLQTWTDGAAQHIASGMMAYLATQKFAHAGHFSAVMPALTPIVKNSDYITVIIICTGTDAIQGTPFDEQLQKSMRAWRDEQQKAEMPLVVVLSAAHGQFRDYRVTPAQWQVEMPPLPADLVQARQIRPKIVAAAPVKPTAPTAVVMAQPLIVSGKHHDAPVETAAPALAPSVPEALLETNLSVQANTVATNAIASVTATSLPNTSSAPPTVIPAISSESRPEPPKNKSSAAPETVEKDSNRSLTNASASPSVSALNATSTIAMPSPRDGSVLVKRLVLLGAVLSAIVGIVVVRRSQHTHVSLITHSIDRERE